MDLLWPVLLSAARNVASLQPSLQQVQVRVTEAQAIAAIFAMLLAVGTLTLQRVDTVGRSRAIDQQAGAIAYALTSRIVIWAVRLAEARGVMSDAHIARLETMKQLAGELPAVDALCLSLTSTASAASPSVIEAVAEAAILYHEISETIRLDATSRTIAADVEAGKLPDDLRNPALLELESYVQRCMIALAPVAPPEMTRRLKELHGLDDADVAGGETS